MIDMSAKKRIILDTNIYGAFLEKGKTELVEHLRLSQKVIIYGFDEIRRELRNTPITKRFGRRSFRTLILEAYDTLTQRHEYETDSMIENLASEYTFEYGGGISKKEMHNDFLIVACASVHGLDIVVTDDHHSMASDPAKRAYETINRLNGFKTPHFYNASDLEKLL